MHLVDLVVFNSYFDLVQPFTFYNEICYFSVCEQKFAKFFMSFQKAQVSFLSNFTSIFGAIKHYSSVLLLAQTYTLVNSSLSKCKFLRFWNARVTIIQIPHANCELINQFLFKFCFILHCHDT